MHTSLPKKIFFKKTSEDASEPIEMRPDADIDAEFDIEDGNADKEAEKLIPSPNFYVLIVLFIEFTSVKRVFILGTRFPRANTT